MCGGSGAASFQHAALRDAAGAARGHAGAACGRQTLQMRGRAAILAVAQDRACPAPSAQCTRSWWVRPGERLQFQPGDAALGAVQRAEVGDGARAPPRRRPTARVRSPRGPPCLTSARSMRPSSGCGLADHDGPVGLLDVAAAEGARPAPAAAAACAPAPARRRCRGRGGAPGGGVPRRSKRSASSMPSRCFAMPGPPCTARPCGLSRTMHAAVAVDHQALQRGGVALGDGGVGLGAGAGPRAAAGCAPAGRRAGGCRPRRACRRRGSGRCAASSAARPG